MCVHNIINNSSLFICVRVPTTNPSVKTTFSLYFIKSGRKISQLPKRTKHVSKQLRQQKIPHFCTYIWICIKRVFPNTSMNQFDGTRTSIEATCGLTNANCVQQYRNYESVEVEIKTSLSFAREMADQSWGLMFDDYVQLVILNKEG